MQFALRGGRGSGVGWGAKTWIACGRGWGGVLKHGSLELYNYWRAIK